MEERINELESRLAFQDDTIQKLNDVIVEQQQQIDQLSIQMSELKEQIQSLVPVLVADEAQEIPPPHY
ncbi:MAG: SlyX family protein [Gammaproteobacteria bacterium]|jgi:SlyX protein